MGKMFPGAHCWENLRLLSETSVRLNSYCATFFMGFTDWFTDSQVK